MLYTASSHFKLYAFRFSIKLCVVMCCKGGGIGDGKKKEMNLVMEMTCPTNLYFCGPKEI